MRFVVFKPKESIRKMSYTDVTIMYIPLLESMDNPQDWGNLSTGLFPLSFLEEWILKDGKELSNYFSCQR